MILYIFLVVLWYFLALRHLYETYFKAWSDLRWTNQLHNLWKTKVPKDGSFQWFLESIATNKWITMSSMQMNKVKNSNPKWNKPMIDNFFS